MKKKTKQFSWPEWPIFFNEEQKKIKEVLKTNILFNGRETKQLELEFSKYNNSKYVKVVGNATQGLHLSLAALGIGAGDEVIVTNYSWISTASCILMQNAIPVFVDIEPKNLSIDLNQIEKKINSKTKAIIFVHMFGYITDPYKLIRLAKKYKLKLIEDASHAHGASYQNKKAGNFGDIAVLSMQQRKNLSCGDGAIVVCKNNYLSNKIYQLRSFGNKELSYNYRISEIAAGIARVRLKRLNQENKQRKEIALKIEKKMNSLKSISILKPEKNTTAVYYKLIFFYEYKNFKKNLDFFIKFMNQNKIPITKTYPPLNLHSNFNLDFIPARGTTWKKPFTKKKFPKKMKYLHFPITSELSLKRVFQLNIPPYLKEKHINNLVNKIKKFIKIYQK